MRRRILYALLPWLVTAGCAAHHLDSIMVTGKAELVGPGVISTELPEFATTTTPDGNTLFFNRASPDRSKLTIMMSSRTGGPWTHAIPAPFSGQYRDVDPFMTPDGRRLYFSSDRPRTGHPASMNTWYVERTGSGWTDPVDVGEPLNSDSTDIFVSVSAGGTMVFSSNRDGPMRVYQTWWNGTEWSKPEPVAFGATIAGGNPLISPDGRFMVLVEAPPGTKADLMVSCHTSAGWTEPRPLTDVNTRYGEFAPGFGASSHELYFTSERPGIVAAQPDSVRPPGDIYRIRLPDSVTACH